MAERKKKKGERRAAKAAAKAEKAAAKAAAAAAAEAKRGKYAGDGKGDGADSEKSERGANLMAADEVLINESFFDSGANTVSLSGAGLAALSVGARPEAAPTSLTTSALATPSRRASTWTTSRPLLWHTTRNIIRE